MEDPSLAPLIARQSLGRAGVAKPPRPLASEAAPRELHDQLLPHRTTRRYLRPRVRLRKLALFAHPFRCLRPERYKPLPDGWEWPPLPHYSDLPLPPRKKKRRKRMPPEVLAEIRDFHKRTAEKRGASRASLPANFSEDEAEDPMALVAERDQYSDGGDSAAGEVPSDDYLGAGLSLGDPG